MSKEPAHPAPAAFLRNAKAIGFVERYLLSALFLWLAWRELLVLRELLFRWPQSAGIWSIRFVVYVREFSLFLVQLLIGGLLLITRRAAQAPRRMAELLVPLAMSLFFLAYSVAASAPAALRASVLPAPAQIPCALAALVSGLCGALIAVWGVASLGRSFGIFVSVREVVLRGPYEYVRHPIYLGYLFVWIGLVLANQSILTLLLVLTQTGLMVWRARLEENRLAEASPEYRTWMARTGFLFPRFAPPQT